MYIAELKGKVPSSVKRMEDILTSNIFSFFKYSDRKTYLKSFLKCLELELNDNDLINADFIFWPRYNNETEPDLVIIVGRYYLLFEAKYFSDFSQETPIKKYQLIREIEGGVKEAELLGKEFRIVAITNDYCYKKERFKGIDNYKVHFIWINWQAITGLLLKLIEKYGSKLHDYLFVQDLYNLLLKKNLRSFRAINKINFKPVRSIEENVFYKTIHPKGVFAGFKHLAEELGQSAKSQEFIFYNKYFFKPTDILIPEKNKIFYRTGENNE